MCFSCGEELAPARAAAPRPAAGRSPRRPPALEDQRRRSPGTQLRERDRRSSANASGAARRQQRHLDRRSRSNSARGHRREARIAERGADARWRATSSPSGRCASSVPMQPRSSAVLRQRDERRAGCSRSQGSSGVGAAPRAERARRSRRARCASSVRPAVASSASHAAAFAERERRIADHARSRPPAVSPELRRSSSSRLEAARGARTASRPLSGVAPQACSWSRPASSARIASTVARSIALRVVVGLVVRKIGADDDQRLRAAPQRVEHVGDLSARRASPTTSGTSAKSPSTRCRNGSCTSSECSCACAAALTPTCGRPRERAAPPPRRPGRRRAASRTPRAAGSARPRTATRCAGPSSTTRVTVPRARTRAARTRAAATAPGVDVAGVRDNDRLRRGARGAGRPRDSANLRRQAGGRPG